MREILFRGKCKTDNEWVYGFPYVTRKNAVKINWYCSEFGSMRTDEVAPETVGQYTGLTDKNGKRIFEGDIVKIVDFQMGCVVYECGAFGIAVKPYIDWNYLDSEIAEITGCNNSPDFCRNDNFISLWELMWNYNQEENSCDVVQVIGNIHDNPELLEGGTE